jgi:microcystin-dependent protein
MALVYPLKNYDPGQYEGPVDTSADQLVAFGFYPQSSASPDLNVGIEREAGTGKLILKTASTNISLRIGGSEYAWLDTTGQWNANKLAAANNLYSPNLDTASAGALAIGGVNATSITLGVSGGVTSILGQLTFNNNYLNCLRVNNGTTFTNGCLITTKIPWAQGQGMCTLHLIGYNYGAAASIGLSLSFYLYNTAPTTVVAPGLWSFGKSRPTITIGNIGGFACIYITGLAYYASFSVQAFGGGSVGYMSGWTWADAAPSWAAGTNFTFPYNDVAGASNLGYLSAADWTAFNGKQAALGFTPVPNTRQVIAGAGLTGGGALSADLTLNVVANADGSIVVAADSIQVGVLATDAQHGIRGGGTLHAAVIAAGAAGFMLGADKTKLDGIATGAQVNDTAAQILAELITVDGAGSSLDADLLDGQQGSYYQAFLQKSMFGGYTYDSAVDLNTLNTTFEARFLQSNQTNGPGVSGMSYYFGLAGGDTSARGIQLVADVANFWWRERSVGTWRKFWHDGNLVDRSNSPGFLTTTGAARLADLNAPPYGFSYWDNTSSNRPYGWGTLLSWAYAGTNMAVAGNWLFELGISTDFPPQLVFRNNINASGWSAWCQAWTNQNLTNLNQLTNGPAYITAAALAGYAPLASPALTGIPTAPTASAGTSSMQIATTAFVATQAAATLPTGTVLSFAGSSAPSGYLLCDGAAVSRTTYAALYAVVGTTYGTGDGSTTFNVPDGRSRTVVGAGQGTGLTNRTRGGGTGAAWGEESHTLSQAEMPSHTHVDTGHNHGGAVFADNTHSHRTAIGFDSGGTLFCRANSLYMPMDGSDVQLSCRFTAGLTQVAESLGRYAFTGSPSTAAAIPSGSAAISSAGSGSAHNNMPPFLVMNYIIKT